MDNILLGADYLNVEYLFQEVNMAYENVKEVDCLEMSPEGEESWEAAVARYEERIDRVCLQEIFILLYSFIL